MSHHLLWYDGDPQRTLEDKIKRAVSRYRDKYGQVPGLVVLPAGTEHPGQVDGLRVLTSPTCLANHIQVWNGGQPHGKKD
jgi:hypothetical protein